MRLLRLPGASLRNSPEERHFIVNVEYIVHLGDFINKNPDGSRPGSIRENNCTVKLVDGSWLYVGLPMKLVAAMMLDEDCAYQGDDQ
tara:strand:- start:555 stop:815 length:261 start_codon:yes stop_codon:yes gene_type:complete